VDAAAGADALLIPASATLERAVELTMDPMGEDIHPDPRMPPSSSATTSPAGIAT
jgi:hypothetical protein